MSEQKNRFSLDAEDLLDRLIAIFITVKENENIKGHEYQRAKEIFDSLPWTPKEIETWSIERRMIGLYFANYLAIWHLASEKEIMRALSGFNSNSPAGAVAWHEAVLMGLYREYDRHITVPLDCDGDDYLRWLFGTSNKPTESDWANVPL